MSARVSKICLVVYAALLLLSTLLLSVPGDYWGWYAIMAPFALPPLCLGPRWYRLAGGLALLFAGVLITGDIESGKHHRERMRRIREAAVARTAETGEPAADWPQSARAAVYSRTATPGFDSPEGVSRLLEQRWSLPDVRAFCIPERRHNDAYQNLVIDTPQAWKGRLYADTLTGFDRISWYATVREGRVQEYSLEAYRGGDFWLLEIGSPETVRAPPKVAPDSSAPYFIGHK